MTHDALEDDLRRALARGPLLPSAARRRGLIAAMHAAGATAPASRRRRTVTAVGIAGALLVAASATATVAHLTGGSFGSSPEARQKIASDPALAFGPWFHQPDGSPRLADVEPRPSLRFPPGTTYAQALTMLLVSVKDRGTIPDGTALEPPLPTGRVLVRSSDPAQGLAIDLRAPFGYALPGGRILPPSFSHPASYGAERATRSFIEWAEGGRVGIPDGAHVNVPHLRACMVLDPEAPTPACDVDPPG